MKLEDTLGNKARFFVLYWGQKVQSYKLTYAWRQDVEVSGLASGFLRLTPLSQITDEDAKMCSNYFPRRKGDSWVNSYKEKFLVKQAEEITKASDYLRSKGYAVPWMGLSVDDLVSYGWVKLKEA